MNNKTLVYILRAIAVVQFLLGGLFLAAPAQTAALLGLSVAPRWTAWLFGMMAARFLGYGYGMLVAARAPEQNRSWIVSMMAIQAIDWLVTAIYLYTNAVTLAQVSTAAFLPLVFIILVWRNLPRASA